MTAAINFQYQSYVQREGRLYGTVIYFTEAFAQLDTTHSSFDSEFPYFTLREDVLLPLDISRGTANEDASRRNDFGNVFGPLR